MTTDLLSRHRERLDAAVAACASRGFYSAFDESPSPRVYGETAAADGKAAFEAWLDGDFPLETPGSDGTVATERSPYGFDLGVRYPRVPDADAAVDALMARGGRGHEGVARRRARRGAPASAWRSWTGCTAGSSSWPTRSSTPAGRRS